MDGEPGDGPTESQVMDGWRAGGWMDGEPGDGGLESWVMDRRRAG